MDVPAFRVAGFLAQLPFEENRPGERFVRDRRDGGPVTAGTRWRWAPWDFSATGSLIIASDPLQRSGEQDMREFLHATMAILRSFIDMMLFRDSDPPNMT